MFGKNIVDIDDILGTFGETSLLVERLLRLIANDKEHEQETLRTVEWLLNDLGKADAFHHAVDHYDRQQASTRGAIINWGLVMLWATFEAWNEDLLLLFFKSKPESFLGWVGEKQLTYKEALERSTIDEIREAMYRKAVREFTGRNINDRIRELEKRLHLSPVDLFSSYNNPFDSTLDLHWDTDTLIRISDQRNDIVHNRKMPLVSMDQLEEISTGLMVVTVNLAVHISQKAGIECTWDFDYVREERDKRLREAPEDMEREEPDDND